MAAMEARMGQQHRCIHCTLPAQPRSSKRLPQSKGRWYKALGVCIHHPTMSQLPVMVLPDRSVSPSCLSSAEPKQTHGRGGPSYCQASPRDASALALRAERGGQQREVQSPGPEVALGFKRHVQVFCACKTSPSLLFQKPLSLQNSGRVGTRKKKPNL